MQQNPSESKGSVSTSSGGCPMDKISLNNKSVSSSPSSSFWPSAWFRRVEDNNQSLQNDQIAANVTVTSKGNIGGGCPVRHSGTLSTPPPPSRLPSPPSIEEAACHPQTPHSGQRVPLSTLRSVSSIPRTAVAPHHQPEPSSENANWIYPSEQQFYNALRRKGSVTASDSSTVESSIPYILRIHNEVNEGGWGKVKEWESMRGNPNPRLVRFEGRPNDLSPRAWMNTTFFMKNKPFDRHDWYVDGGDQEGAIEEGQGDRIGLRRYVIDFYGGDRDSTVSSSSLLTNSSLLPSTSKSTGVMGVLASSAKVDRPNVYLDVRPAFDDTGSAMDRACMLFRDTLPGIYNEMFGVTVKPGWRPEEKIAGASGGNRTTMMDQGQQQG